MNVVVLISGSGSNLQAIIDGAKQGDLPITISNVISNVEGVKGLARAEAAQIKHSVVSHKNYASRAQFDSALMAAIDDSNPDLVVLAGFMRILTPEFVEHYSSRLINIHPSLLPAYPGTNTHQRVLDHNEDWHGASVHFVVPKVDAGPVIVHGRLSVGDTSTASELAARVLKIEHVIYPLAIKWFAENRLSINKDAVLLDGETSVDQLQTFDV